MYNRVTLIGTVGKEPAIKTFDNGNRIANFALATSEKWKDKKTGEYVSKTEWHNVSVSGTAVNYVEKQITKGALLLVEGKIQTRKWSDKNGQDRYMTEIVVGIDGKVSSLNAKRETEKPNQGGWEEEIPL